MQVNFKISRFDPATNGKSQYQNYTVEIDEGSSVLDGLHQIRDQQDGTLSFRGSCRTGFCGDCTMRVNGKAKWACRTTVSKAEKDGEISLETPRLVKTEKDLVYDQDTFLFDKYKAVKPWTESLTPEATQENIVSQEKIKELQESKSID